MIVENAPVTAELPVRRLTRDEYHRMHEAGILGDDRTELLGGQIMLMLPIGDPHIACVDRLTTLFARRLYVQDEPPAHLSVQNPVRLSPADELVPDVMLVRPAVQAEFRAAHAEDVLLVVEVAVSSLAYDQGPKLRRYALHGIPEVWVVALERERVYVYREPQGEEYRLRQTRSRGDRLGVEALPQLDPLPAADVLGPAAA